MAIGFILISTAPAKEHEVYNELLKVKEIVELHPLFAEYDLIAKSEAEDFNILGQVVVDKIRSIPGVIDTKTLTGIKFLRGNTGGLRCIPSVYVPADPAP